MVSCPSPSPRPQRGLPPPPEADEAPLFAGGQIWYRVSCLLSLHCKCTSGMLPCPLFRQADLLSSRVIARNVHTVGRTTA